MIKDVRQTLERKGYTADEINMLLKSFTELLDALMKEATLFSLRHPPSHPRTQRKQSN